MASNEKSIAGSAANLGREILDALKEDLGDNWNELRSKHQATLTRATKLFAKLTFKKLQGKDVDVELEFIKSGFLDFSYVGSQETIDAFWRSADKVVGVAASFLSGVIRSQISGSL